MNEGELQNYVIREFPKESESIEWKDFSSLKQNVSGRSGEDIISYISGIGNMQGGSLIIGIEDESARILGIDDVADYNIQNIKERILGNCTNLSSEGLEVIEIITSDTQKRVWIFKIPQHDPRKPVYAHKKAWQRIGASLHEMKSEKLDSILHEPLRMADDWSAGIIKEASIEDLDVEAIRKARENFKEKNPHLAKDLGAWSDVVFLNKAKLTIRGKITRAALILLGKAENTPLLMPAVAKITWILRGEKGEDVDYEHFEAPFLLAVDSIYKKIRNLKYRFIVGDTLFPIEITRYDPYVIREALNNCIAHQDYEFCQRVTVVEAADSLTFINAGSFLPGSLENVIENDAPSHFYRNSFLAAAMVNLNMIDTIGSGIRRMFKVQRERFFPLPDFNLTKEEQVIVTIQGRIIDEKYSLLLSQKKNLTLKEVIILDKVQKKIRLSRNEFQLLKLKKLIEGRYPNVFFSSSVATLTGQTAKYIRTRGFDKKYYLDMIIQYLREKKGATRNEVDELLLDKLPDIYTPKQKIKKISNLLSELSKNSSIVNKGNRRISRWTAN